MTISLAAVFLVKIRACRVKNARKMSNLAVLFSLHPRIFPQKTASQAECQQPLGHKQRGRLKSRKPVFQTASNIQKPFPPVLLWASMRERPFDKSLNVWQSSDSAAAALRRSGCRPDR
ncbi:hypothetical protein CGZ77_06295 [Neisseria sp. KEM232]|nr:hypothetical protein CGZ77_06295 [Neisseria sp. KEM232]